MTNKRSTKTHSKRLVKAYFPPNQIPRLEKAAKREGLSVSSFIVQTVLQRLEAGAQ